ncbi:MarR family winged helix-turn-helix transcriptional regulator [Actinomadura formosensis]|uniref:MarR family winged helix-turn-helix transcriptional regulator n=1 Tax=Actinomadura formosensis TaxID=60706 RepID=UPI003D8E823A
MSDDGEAAIGDVLIDVLDAVLYFDKKQVVQAEGVRLYPSEVHMLVSAMHGASFTQMARQFGISKGAVSQTFLRLAGKGVLVVGKDRARKNSATITLTPLGRTLLEEIMALRGRLGEDLARCLDGYSEAELETLKRFVLDLRTFVRESLVVAPKTSDGTQEGGTR